MRPVLLLVVLAACGPKQSSAETSSEVAIQRLISERPTADGLVLQEVDLNGDRRADVYNYFKDLSGGDRRLVRKETDLNLDGRVDVITFFDADGALEREDMDGDFDGRFDHVDHYQDGRRVLAEWDTNYDDRPDIFVYYEQVGDEMLATRKERDTTGDGRIDTWERYDREGNVIKIGRDIDGDGKVDERDE